MYCRHKVTPVPLLRPFAQATIGHMDANFDFTANDYDAISLLEQQADQRAAELSGDDELPEDELRIVFNFRLSHEEKLARLQALRASKRVKPKSFSKRLTRAGRIHARALGVLLD